MALVVEAELSGEHGQRDLAICESLAGDLDAPASYVVARRFTVAAAEGAGDADRGRVDRRRDLGEARGAVVRSIEQALEVRAPMTRGGPDSLAR